MRDSFVPFVSSTLQASEQSKAQNRLQLFANITHGSENANGLAGHFHNYGSLSLLGKEEARRSYVLNLTYT